MRLKTLFRVHLKLLAILFLGLTLAACGGSSSDSRLDNINNGGNTGGNGGTGGGGGGSTTFSLGNGSGSSFTNSQIGVGIGGSQLSAGGETTLTVNLVDADNALLNSDVQATFNSPCLASNAAILKAVDNTLLDSNTVSTSNGQITLVYQANGCVGTDLITASASHNGITRTATASLTIESDTIQTISFVDATPSLISLKGTGGTETSIVRFRVLGSTGAPMRDVDVNFSLNTTVGGLQLTNASAVTNPNGYASTTVQSGTIATSVRVTAHAVGTDVSTQSNALLVSTGIPDQKSMSLATSAYNPAGWDYDGVTATLTARLADAFNNPVPNGTTVSFRTEGGSIGSSSPTDTCETINGACTVTWTSQNPRPQRADGDLSMERLLCLNEIEETPGMRECEASRAGRITLLATAIGNESFIDVNGNGFFDPGVDIFSVAGDCERNVPISSHSLPLGSPKLACDDLSEAYLDKNEDGTRDVNEEFVDTNNNGIYTSSNGIYNGALCREADASAGNCSRESVHIRQEVIMVMSCNHPVLNEAGRLHNQPADIVVPTGGSNSFAGLIADCNGNALPAGTMISVNGGTAKNTGFNVNPDGGLTNRLGPSSYTITVISTNDTEPSVGDFTISVTVPTPDGSLITTTASTTINYLEEEE